MINKLLRTGEKKTLRGYSKTVESINRIEPEMEALEDDEFRTCFQELRERWPKESLDQLLPESFALTREAARRVLGQRHYDVQLIGGIALHNGGIAEMKTGEGKTLTATLPVVLNAIAGEGVHVVTVNDYLAQRDGEWMGEIYEALGLSIGIIQEGASIEERRAAYAADITYVTNSELGFDYLKDNLVLSLADKVQRGLTYAIIDEIDNILIDEARTPLIISGPPTDGIAPADSEKTYRQLATLGRRMKGVELQKTANAIFAKLPEERAEDFDYEFDEKDRVVSPSEQGIARVEKELGVDLYSDDDDTEIIAAHFQQALQAEALYKRDRDYAVVKGEIAIIDPNTGRLMEDRKWSDGLHQAIQAKEGLRITPQDHTHASVTYQNFFRSYEKLAGMTGTALTEAAEFQKIYGLSILEIPTHLPIRRIDREDRIYKTLDAKWEAVIHEIKVRHSNGQPLLIGTASVEHSEHLASLLKKEKILYNLLNAKPEHAAREAEIIAEAGRSGKVTIATNMAGRGVDIKLGGDDPEDAEQVRELGGLFVLATERHDSRRIDNQLRGRSGRQGDPGESVFYISAEDQIIRLFAGDKLFKTIGNIEKISPGAGEDWDKPLESKTMSKLITSAQEKVEKTYFLDRKRVLEYDDVLNEQRRIIYEYRDQLLEDIESGTSVAGLFEPELERLIEKSVNEFMVIGSEDPEGLANRLSGVVEFEREEIEDSNPVDTIDLLFSRALETYRSQQEKAGDEEASASLEAQLLLRVIDTRWQRHLQAMDEIREGIHLRGFSQLDPLVEYKNEGFKLFETMIRNIWLEYATLYFRAEITRAE